MTKKNKLLAVVIVVIIISFIGFGFLFSDNNNRPPGISKFDMQIMYYPTINSSIEVYKLGLDNQSIDNINNETFSIIINSPDTNKSVEYNLILHDDVLEIEFDETSMNPRLNLGFIDEDKNYSLEFIFNIMSDDADIQNVNVWGESNKVEATISYNSANGLVLTYAKIIRT